MHHTLNASIPQHLYGLVEQNILRGSIEDSACYDRCVIFGITSIPSRALHFSIMTEVGSQWARILLEGIWVGMNEGVVIPEDAVVRLGGNLA